MCLHHLRRAAPSALLVNERIHEEAVPLRRVKFTLRIVTALQGGNQTQGGKEKEDITSMDSVAKKRELCPARRDQKGGISWPRRGPTGQAPAACGWCLWLELWRKSILQTHQAHGCMVKAAIHQCRMVASSWDGLSRSVLDHVLNPRSVMQRREFTQR